MWEIEWNRLWWNQGVRVTQKECDKWDEAHQMEISFLYWTVLLLLLVTWCSRDRSQIWAEICLWFKKNPLFLQTVFTVWLNEMCCLLFLSCADWTCICYKQDSSAVFPFFLHEVFSSARCVLWIKHKHTVRNDLKNEVEYKLKNIFMNQAPWLVALLLPLPLLLLGVKSTFRRVVDTGEDESILMPFQCLTVHVLWVHFVPASFWFGG